MKRFLFLLLASLPLFAQDAPQPAAGEPLSLREAVTRAMLQNPGIEASKAREKSAGSRVDSAKSGYLPRVNYQEMVQRGDNPVYVFGALLTQRQFTERNFAIPSLNQPDFLNNFQSMVTVDQVVYNAGRTRNAVRSAEIGREMGQFETHALELQLVQRVVEAYFGVKLGEAATRAAEESIRSAAADLERAEAFREEGMTTDADVLSIRVHLAGVRQEAVKRRMQLGIARAALNISMGDAEDATFALTTPLTETAYDAPELEPSQRAAVSARPEARIALRGIDSARSAEKIARSAYWPEVFLRGAFEADRQEFVNKGGANWFIGAGLRWNVFNGMETKARVAESRHAVAAAEAQERQAASGIRFEVRRAWLEWNSVAERLALAGASIAEAEESLRITRDRYANGLGTVTDLLRTETALLAAKTGYLAALYEQRTAAVRLEAARGSLDAGSMLFD